MRVSRGEEKVELEIGMVGLDTSHCEAFVKLFNYPEAEHHVPGCRVVAAYAGGSELCAVSRDRVAGFAESLQDEHGLEICESIEEVGGDADAFLLESVDGRQHLEQFRTLAAFGKPVFIDKPMTCSLYDAEAIAELAEVRRVPVMSASSIRYAPGIAGLVPDGAQVHGCDAFGPMPTLDDYPAYFWYGIHSAEVLFSYMGSGCASVQATHQQDGDLLVGRWEDGRIGVARGTRLDGGSFGCTVHSSDRVAHGTLAAAPPAYAVMLGEVAEFFRTGIPSIDLTETLQIIAFLDAAGRSLEQSGEAVPLVS